MTDTNKHAWLRLSRWCVFVCFVGACSAEPNLPADMPDVTVEDTAALDVTDDATDAHDVAEPLGSLHRPDQPGALYVTIAHPDDDLLFINPVIQHTLSRALPVRVVVLTAGDACGTRAPEDRRAGLQAAYEQMLTGAASLSDTWTCNASTLEGIPVEACAREGTPHVSFLFLAMPDCAPALEPLVVGQPVPTLDGHTLRYASLVDALAGDIAAVAPSAVHTLDGADAFGLDNSDHVITAYATFDAVRAAAPNVEFVEHRTYNVHDDPINLPGQTVDTLWAALLAYCGPAGEDAQGERRCSAQAGVPFWEWIRRDLSAFAVHGPLERIGNRERCLRAADGAVVLGLCDDASARWTDGRIALANQCLVRAGATLRWGDCTSSAARWTLMSHGQLRGDAGTCLTASEAPSPSIAPCGGAAPPYAPETELNDPWTEPTVTQRWSGQHGPAAPSDVFSDAALGDAATTRAFFMADVNGDGRDDLCARQTDGLACALRTETVGPAIRWTDELSDAAGWGPEARDGSLRMADIDGDGDDDVCGLGGAGIVCIRSETDGGAASERWRSGGFSDDAEHWDTQQGWGAFQLADVDNDGRADACARRPDGIACGLSNGSAFEAPTLWSPDAFDDTAGWNAPRYAATLRFGDVNGDDRTDVCGRGRLGLQCALGDGARFAQPTFWGHRTSLADSSEWPAKEQFWASFALVDINRDGRDDACVRRPDGLACGFSNGAAFGLLIARGGYGDELGYGDEFHGGSVRWGNVDGDGVPDVCARGTDGVVCRVGR